MDTAHSWASIGWTVTAPKWQENRQSTSYKEGGKNRQHGRHNLAPVLLLFRSGAEPEIPVGREKQTALDQLIPFFFTHDAIRDPLPDGFDVVTCSLFLHHLSDDDAGTVLRRIKDAAGRLVLVNDLARSRFNFLAVWLACHLTTRSRVVRFDGPASVRSAFTPAEAAALAGRAGMTGATVSHRFPCRFLLSWSRT